MTRLALALLLYSAAATAQSFSAPAGIRPAIRRPGAAGILPGGRVLSPSGEQHPTGAGPFGLAVSASGRTVVTANIGPVRSSILVLERERAGAWSGQQIAPQQQSANGGSGPRDDTWRGVGMGVAFADERAVYVSEGDSGRVRLIDLASGQSRRSYDLNQGGFSASFTGDLAFDAERGVLYVLDQANFRMAVIDTRAQRIAASIRVGRLPFALALSPDRRRVYVTNLGMFDYGPAPGGDTTRTREIGLGFPAFGFPSRGAGGVGRVPGSQDPNAPESNSVCVVDVSAPASPKVEAFVRTGLPVGLASAGGSSPSGVVAAGERVFVSNAHNDSISVIDAKTNRVEGEIALRIPGLETLRGVTPLGLAFHEPTGWLLVAEAGINAVGVVDPRLGSLLGHMPVGWYPSRVAVDRDTVYVTNLKGQGSGPGGRGVPAGPDSPLAGLGLGTLSVLPVPRAGDLERQTAAVLEANGFRPRPQPPAPMPAGIRHVVLIVKENRSFDELFGDAAPAANGPMMGAPRLARFGRDGYADGRGQTLSLHHINIAPNHRAIAERWVLSDNFYADSESSMDGRRWLNGAYPNAWTQTSLLPRFGPASGPGAPGRLALAASRELVLPEEVGEAGTLWSHLTRHGVSFQNFGDGGSTAGSNAGLSDQSRASRFIAEIEKRFAAPGADLPRFLYVALPGDEIAEPNASGLYPYEASFMADNDYALGRIVEYLSQTKWWGSMAVFVTEASARGGADHIDARRTVLLGAGPWFKRNYVSHTNTSFPGLLKTLLRLLGVPPMNLFDAAASDLSDCFAARPDLAGYRAIEVDRRIFDARKAKP